MKPRHRILLDPLGALLRPRSHWTLALACGIGAALAACFSPASPEEAQCPTSDADNACEVCVKQNCCAELTACREDPDCDCASECIGEMGPSQVDACLGICDIDIAPAELDTLSECAEAADCGAACE
jgi:hypothetical protein